MDRAQLDLPAVAAERIHLHKRPALVCLAYKRLVLGFDARAWQFAKLKTPLRGMGDLVEFIAEDFSTTNGCSKLCSARDDSVSREGAPMRACNLLRKSARRMFLGARQ